MPQSETTAELTSALLRARAAKKAKDWPGVLSSLSPIGLNALAPPDRIQVLMMRGRALHFMGKYEDSVVQFQGALSIFAAAKILRPENPDPNALATAEMLATGARDVRAVQSLLAFRAREFFNEPREFKIAPVVNILDWCRRSGVAIAELDPAGPVVAGGDALNPEIWRYDVEQAWAVGIPGGEIIAGWDFAIAPTGEVLEGGNYMPLDRAFPFMPHLLNPEINLIAHVWSSEPIVVDEDVLFVGTPERHVFGHWLNDFLPRLRAWRGQGKQKLAIPNTLPTKHRALLARFGVKSADLVECALGKRYRFRELTVAQAGSDLKPQPRSLHFVRSALALPPAGQPKRKFFMIRDAGTRMPANTAAFDRVLAEFGIEKVNPAKWSLEEQERLLADTSLIVAAFGTELLCMYHLPKGADVIELSFDAARNSVFGPKSAILGFRHHFVPCARVDSGRREQRKIDGDLVIDCEALHRTLAEIGARR